MIEFGLRPAEADQARRCRPLHRRAFSCQKAPMARAWHLKSRPDGTPTHENFELKNIDLPQLEDGQVRVRNLWLSVDPYMRGRMNEGKSYIPPFQIDAPMDGGAIGEVMESKADGFAPGDLVSHFAGWRDEAVLPAKALTKRSEEHTS